MYAPERAVAVPLVIVASLFAHAPGLATVYHPLDIGTEWHYADELDQTHSRAMTGTREVLGVDTVVRHEEIWQGETLVDVFENYWTEDAEGDLYLHGAANLMSRWPLAYVPPVLMVDAPLQEGKSWVTENIQRYELDGTPWGDPFNYDLRVYSEGDISVPAGTFYAYAVGDTAVYADAREVSGQILDVFGCRVTGSALAGSGNRDDIFVEWYSENVGVVRHGLYSPPEHNMELISLTPVEVASWGRVKALFR
ncbi:hypothetical protein KAW64_12070 [bacterium]|nr:hypothetical protein [bacterium]